MSRSAAIDNLASAQMYVGGTWVDAADGAVLDSIDPTTEQAIATFPEACPEDVDTAVEAARRAAPGWQAIPASERGELLGRFADHLEQHLDELAEIDSVDVGNPLDAMRNDVA
ncbi:MAG TPA: aldehyde dehydrogenase family protein, partial [Acidimicrobiia bacterium]